MDQFALQKAYAAQVAQAHAYISQGADMGQIGGPDTDCRETEFAGLSQRLANLIGRAENLAIHLSDISDRLLGSAVATNGGGVQANAPRPVPNGLVQALSMGLDVLEVNLDRASNMTSRLSGAI